MSKPNPLPILVDRCDLKLGVLRQILPPIYWQHIDSLHRQIPMPKLVEKSGLTEKAIRKYLPRSRVPIRHVKAIGSFAIEYRDAMASKKSRDGVDPRYIILHRTLTDRRRMKMYGDLDED
jgi:hypothetical protein